MDTHSCKNSGQSGNTPDPGPVPLCMDLDLSGISYKNGNSQEGIRVICKDADATEALGRLLGKLAESEDVYCLSGDLGAGKTLLSQGVATSLGVPREDVVSPTFAIMNIYGGEVMEVRHFDLYRLNSPEELADIGFYEYAGGPGVTLVEWADLFTSELPPEYLHITLTIHPEGREVELMPLGPRYEQLCEDVLRYVDTGAGHSN